MNQWDLFIDETGDFRNRDAAVFVVGVLARHGVFDSTKLEDGLRSCAPIARWPLHASRLKSGIAWAVWYAFENEINVNARRDAFLERIARTLQSAQPRAFGECLAQVRSAKDLGYETLKKLLMSLEPRDRRRLAHYPAEATASHRAYRARISASLNTAQHVTITVVASGESQAGDAWPASGHAGSEPGVRYLVLLRLLLARVQAVLFGLPGKHHVDVRPLGFTLVDRDTGARRYLLARDIKTTLPPSLAACEFEARSPLSATENMKPEFVLADHVANALLFPLQHRSLSLADVEQNALEAGGFPVRTVRSHLTATASAMSTGPDLDIKRPLPRRWCVEQSQEWAASGVPG